MAHPNPYQPRGVANARKEYTDRGQVSGLVDVVRDVTVRPTLCLLKGNGVNQVLSGSTQWAEANRDRSAANDERLCRVIVDLCGRGTSGVILP